MTTSSWQSYVREALARVRSGEVDETVIEELAQHAEAAHEAARLAGEAEEAAVSRARAVVDECCAGLAHAKLPHPRSPVAAPPESGSRGIGSLAADVRFGLRLLRRHKGFTASAAGTLALGLAAATTVLGLVYGVLLKPLPWNDPGRIVRLSERRGFTRMLPPLLTNGTLLAWRDRHQTLSDIAVWSTDLSTVETGTGASRRAHVVATSASLFRLLGVRPLLGHAFAAAAEQPGRDRVALLSFEAWRRWFGGDRGVVGHTLRIDGRTSEILGVMPRGFTFPNDTAEIWTPVVVPAVTSPGGEQTVVAFDAIGRLAKGATLDQVAAEGTARARSAPALGLVGTAMFGTREAPRVVAEPLLRAWTDEVRPALLLLLAAVGLLVASAVANIAGLQLARALNRRREMAVRAAIGAGSGRIARQLLVENALLGLLAGVIGILLSTALLRLLPRLAPADFPRLHEVALDAQVAVPSLLVALIAGLVLGLFPVLLLRGRDASAGFAEDGQLRLGRVQVSVARGRSAIMAAQIAMAVVLLVGAGLLARSLRAQWTADRGFEPRNLLTARLPLPVQAYGAAERRRIVDDVLARSSAVPGVTAAAASNVLPLIHSEMVMGFNLPARTGSPAMQAQAGERLVSPAYFRALGMRLIEGRELAESDGPTSMPVVVVNRAFVRTYLGDRALGAVLPLGITDQQPEWHVVGVVDDVRQQAANDPPRPELYVSYRQLDAPTADPVLVIRTQGDPRAFVADLRAIVRSVAPTVALDSVMTMEERLSTSLARPRLYALLLGAFAVFAVLVTAVGLFGVLSYTVAQRTREIGVRCALGATPAEVARLVLRQCATVTAAGIGAGLLLSTALRGSLSSFLFGVAPLDPLTYLLAPLLLVLVALVAATVPARRAARLDPLHALRS